MAAPIPRAAPVTTVQLARGASVLSCSPVRGRHAIPGSWGFAPAVGGAASGLVRPRPGRHPREGRDRKAERGEDPPVGVGRVRGHVAGDGAEHGSPDARRPDTVPRRLLLGGVRRLRGPAPWATRTQRGAVTARLLPAKRGVVLEVTLDRGVG